MDIITIERDFTAWIAERLKLIVDENCFRGGIPDGIEEGVAVLFGAEMKSAGFYGFRPRTWNVQVLAKYDDRDAAMVLLSCLSGLFPCTSFLFGDTEFLTLSPRGSAEPYTALDDGKEKTYVSFNIVVSVLTTGAQS